MPATESLIDAESGPKNVENDQGPTMDSVVRSKLYIPVTVVCAGTAVQGVPRKPGSAIQDAVVPIKLTATMESAEAGRQTKKQTNDKVSAARR